MIIIIEPGDRERLRLFLRQHAQRHAGFHAHRAHAFDHLDDRGHIAVLGVAPCGAHAEALRPGILRLRGRLQHSAHVHQLRGLEPAVGALRLRTIAAIFYAPAGLDAEQRAKLHLAARVMAAVNALRFPHQFVERQVEQLGDFFARPVGARLVILFGSFGEIHDRRPFDVICRSARSRRRKIRSSAFRRTCPDNCRPPKVGGRHS